ncbi:hypothetical protein V8F33_006468 [Rhypophila sp. PSN 637]
MALLIQMSGSSDNDLGARLLVGNESVNRDACVAAMRGLRVPHELGSPLMQYCLIRGMRYHEGFGEELRLATPAFSRAWNARRIMSNTIPDITDPEHIPYCIWHPDVANETTYRDLVQRYPQMKYQVARACAVAGYTDLFHELDILPEINVAEEARDNGHLTIFNDIMAAPVRYAIMNDYDRTVNPKDPRAGAYLNGDTAVGSSLDNKKKIEMPRVYNVYHELGWDDYSGSDADELSVEQRFKPGHFNITEDGNIDTYDGYPEDPEQPRPSQPDLISPLLYSPLPADLPPGNKDVLILMAAYNGDIDRYIRLRRPAPIEKQFQCIIRGIYHNTMFAKWWADRLASHPELTLLRYRVPVDEVHAQFDGMMTRRIIDINKAVTARYIMINNLCRVPISPSNLHGSDLPYTIWYPTVPDEETLRELVRRQPAAKPQAARACIVGGYYDLFEELNPEPDEALLAEAKAQPAGISCFTEWLQDKISKAGPEFQLRTYWLAEGWKNTPRNQVYEPTFRPNLIHARIDEELVDAPFLFNGYNRAIYEGYSVDTSMLELGVSAKGSGLLKEGEEVVDVLKLYEMEGGEAEIKAEE